MQAKDIKEYLLEDTDRVIKVLEESGFHNINRTGNEIRCALPDRSNKSAVSVNLNDNLTTAAYSIDFYGDFFSLLEKVLNLSFKEVVRYISSLFGLSSEKSMNIDNPLKDLLELTSGQKYSSKEQVQYSRKVLDRFVPLPHESLIYEGISPIVCRQFDICFDPQQSRVIFPHFDWKDKSKIVGIKGRTTFDKSVIETLGIPKYWNYIRGYKKSMNLYGFPQAVNQLREKKMLILFEAEKSVLKQFTVTNGKGCSVALGGHTISEEQVEFILQNTPGDCEIVIAFDKDVLTDPEYGKKGICELGSKFKPFRKVSYICDKYNLLRETDSPIDRGVKVWSVLLKFRKEI